MKAIEVRYFASLREKAGKDVEIVEGDFKDGSDLYNHLSDRYRFDTNLSKIKLAINHEYKEWNHPLSNHDKVVFIPPVSGG